MPLENNIKVESHVSIKDKIKVNITSVDPYEWISSVATDRGDGTIWIKDNYNPERAETISSADVSEFAEVDLSDVNIEVAGTYSVYTYFKGLEASYDIAVKPMEMEITCKDMTKDYIYGDEIKFDGDCYATYAKESLSKYVEPSSVNVGEQTEGQTTGVTVTYYDSYYDIGDSYIYNVNIHYEPDNNSAIMNFREIEDFDEWTSSYTEHEIDFGYAIAYLTASHQGPEQPINNEPVTKQGPFIIQTDELRRYVDGISISFDQWGGKQQTVHLDYSEDGGITWKDAGLISGDFWLRGWLPEDVYAQKVRFRFDNASNQIGIRYGIVYTHLEDHPIHKVKITGDNNVAKDSTVTWTANCIIPEESMEWSVISGDGSVELEPYSEVDPDSGETIWKCNITGTSSGNVLIRATCEDGAYDEKELTIISGGSVIYTGSVTFSNVYTVDKTIVSGDEIDIIEEGEEASLGNIKIQFNQSSGGTAPTYYVSGGTIRAYAKNTFRIYFADNSIDGTINSITMESGASSSTSNKCTADVGIINDGEWNTGKATNVWTNNTGKNVKEVIFTEGGTSGNIRFVSITINYTIND